MKHLPRLREDSLMYLDMDAKELQREQERLQAKVDAIKLLAMDQIYKSS